MASLLNDARPPVFCAGCSHDRVVHHLDRALSDLGLQGDQVVIVTDIGCSGLFDTFFRTHAFHGLHGRALTYGLGLKLARPELTVIVTMGDGGIGIGGAHFLAACRRNLDLTLLVLNNFNFGMTGGQFSATTPTEASVGPGFLNRLEKPADVCSLAAAAGAPYVARASAHRGDLPEHLGKAIAFGGFSVVDIHGVCPGRFTRRNRITPREIEEAILGLPPFEGVVSGNQRREYGTGYRQEAAAAPPAPAPLGCDPVSSPARNDRQDVLILGAAGQRIQTAGDLLGLAAMSAGLHVTQKNEYDITVLRGPSISELILSPEAIGYTGIRAPSLVLALAPEGVARRQDVFAALTPASVVLRAEEVAVPPSPATVAPIDFAGQGVHRKNWALAALGVLASEGRVLTEAMLQPALEARLGGEALEEARQVLQSIAT